MISTTTAALTVELTPTQIRGLKLAKLGDLHPQDGNKWTHQDATVTYAKSDRFKEKPLKVKFATSITLGQLREYGLLQSLNPDGAAAETPHGITMAGKMWLLKHK
ncbi:hypothetical protein [Aliirhizobium smilacinae]|uniref:Uncharacterized protein n=1 Tax=Aliirhizobium smilacinae TaxID=1395944 RepID=A0A5C4XQK5_9HYPH|nr:hypothetical protein [Rhizobium smilacinae]TNM65672.1 hypothetical protein FHP24_05340 [Rhizobium smilacinae]